MDKIPEPEDVRFSARYIVKDNDGRPVGRLIANTQPALDAEEQQILRFDLTVRGKPISPDIDGISRFFDLGRETIVHAFAAMTTDRMHSIWERKK